MGRDFLMFFEPPSKCSGEFSYILLITLHPVTFISVYDSTLFEDGIFVLWSHKEVFDGHPSFEVNLIPCFVFKFSSDCHSALYSKVPKGKGSGCCCFCCCCCCCSQNCWCLFCYYPWLQIWSGSSPCLEPI